MHRHLFSFLALAGLFALAERAQADDRDDDRGRGRPVVGLTVSPVPDNSEHQGVLVQQVTPEGPAAKAGLKRGDVITRLGNREVTDGDTLINVLARYKPGDKLRFHVLRDGQEKDFTVTLGQQIARRQS